MQPRELRQLRTVVVALRALLEGPCDARGGRGHGDLSRRWARLGVHPDGSLLARGELGPLDSADSRARTVVEQRLGPHPDGGVEASAALAALVGEGAYCWANRLIALRCLEARELIDEVILRRDVYGDRSLSHHRLARRAPECCAGEDDGLYALLQQTFADQARKLPRLFEPAAAALALRPSPSALRGCIDLLTGLDPRAADRDSLQHVFDAPDALGWAYQYWHATERARLLERIRTDRTVKIEGAAIVSATQLYTEPYMVDFLVDHSLGSLWQAMRGSSDPPRPGSCALQRAPLPAVAAKPVEQITVLDPACGSGHFLLAAFDRLYAMYRQERPSASRAQICRSILECNLFGIDIDRRALQIAEAALWMKAAERCGDWPGASCQLFAPSAEEPAAVAELGSLWRGAAEPVARSTRRRAEAHDRADGAPPSSLRHALQRRYDVVLANPPYIDKRHLGATVRAYLAAHYEAAKGNTFAAFILRCLELGRSVVAMVTPQTFLFVRSYQRLREQLSERASLAVLAQLGAGAFRDAGVDAALFVLHLHDDASARLAAEGLFFDLTAERDKGRALASLARQGASDPSEASIPSYTRSLAQLRSVPGRPFAYRLGPGSLACFRDLPPLRECADVVLGMKTSDNRRFVRRFWELPWGTTAAAGAGWVPYEKRASGVRYGGSAGHWVRWTGATRTYYRTAYSAQLPNERYWFRAGIVYGLVARDFMAKSLGAGHMNDMAASSVFPHDEPLRWPLLGLLNSTIAQWWLGVLNPTVNFQPIDLQRLPVPAWSAADRRSLGRHARQAAESIAALRALQPDDRDFAPADTSASDIESWTRSTLLREIELGARYAMARHEVDVRLSALYELPADELRVMARDVGVAVAGFPLLRGLDRGLRGLPAPAAPPPVPSTPARQRLAAALEGKWVGRTRHGRSLVDAASVVDSTESRPARLDTLTEQLASDVRAHPLSVYRLMSETLDRPGTHVPSVERRLIQDWLTTAVLQQLGHQWPAELAAAESPSVPVAADGIIPLTPDCDAASVVDGVRHRLAASFPDCPVGILERQCSDRLGQPLARWLARGFFKHHLRQFDKRPIAWQLVSRPAGRDEPIFSCLVYALALDGDTVPKIRSRYLKPLRRRLASQRAATGRPSGRGAPRGRQRERTIEAALSELDELDQRLAQLSAAGFACQGVGEELADEPLDRWSAPTRDGEPAADQASWLRAEQRYVPSVHDGVRVNIASWQRAGLLAAAVLSAGDVERALADRARWRASERQWCRDAEQSELSWW